MDLSPALGMSINPTNGVDYTSIDALSDWPTHDFCSRQDHTPRLDVSQMRALQHIVSSDMALIQGPPGTGKTHVSVSALAVMLGQKTPEDPPIVVACQTNHALDQLLRHVAKFEPNFVRLGGRTADEEGGVIKSRTIFALRQANNLGFSKTSSSASKRQRALEKQIKGLTAPLQSGFFDHRIFLKHGVINQAQFDAIESFGSHEHHNDSDGPPVSPITSWLLGRLRPVSQRTPESLGFENIEEEPEDEFIDEAAAERAAQQDEDFEALKGTFLPLNQKWTADARISSEHQKKLMHVLQHSSSFDLKKLNTEHRLATYRVLVSACQDKIAKEFSDLLIKYNTACKDRRIGNFEFNISLLKDAKLVGLTTTGMSKYRALIAATGVKIVLLEEAGESLECTVAPIMVPSVKQFIQVVSSSCFYQARDIADIEETGRSQAITAQTSETGTSGHGLGHLPLRAPHHEQGGHAHAEDAAPHEARDLSTLVPSVRT